MKNKPKLQVMSEEILKAIKNKKTAFYNWKTNGRIKDIHDPFLFDAAYLLSVTLLEQYIIN
jgi:hypothetical protein